MANKLKPLARFDVPKPNKPAPTSVTPIMDRAAESTGTRMYLGLHRAVCREFREEWMDVEMQVRIFRENLRYAREIIA